MVDDNYTDWKIVAVDINDKKAHQYNGNSGILYIEKDAHLYT